MPWSHFTFQYSKEPVHYLGRTSRVARTNNEKRPNSHPSLRTSFWVKANKVDKIVPMCDVLFIGHGHCPVHDHEHEHEEVGFN